MWIVKQSKMGMVNTDHVVSMGIHHRDLIICSTSGHTENIVLGQYKDTDACRKVMDDILLAMKAMATEFDMPKEGDVQ